MSEAQILMAVFEYLDFFLGIVCWKGATFFNEERGLFLSGGFKKKLMQWRAPFMPSLLWKTILKRMELVWKPLLHFLQAHLNVCCE